MSLAESSPERDRSWPSKVLLASPRGFCAGVIRAVEALREFHKRNQKREPGSVTYSYHEIIHNTHVVREFEEAGVVFVDDIGDIPKGANVMFSAHGVSPEVRSQTQERRLNWVDATCPLVEKPHREIKKYAEEGYTILYIGHAGHDEAVGTIGEAPNNIKLIQTLEDAGRVTVSDKEKVALTTQTTLSLDDTARIRAVLKQRFPNIVEPRKQDICYATQNRQDGVKEMVERGAGVIIVVGSPNSSNSKRLREVAETTGAKTYFVDDAGGLEGKETEFLGTTVVGLTSGASVPEDKFQEVVAWFRERGSREFIQIVVEDESKIQFTPPQGIYG